MAKVFMSIFSSHERTWSLDSSCLLHSSWIPMFLLPLGGLCTWICINHLDSTEEVNNLHSMSWRKNELVYPTPTLFSDTNLCILCLPQFIREAMTSAPVSREQAEALVLPIAKFINSCDAQQIRVAPEKCNTLHCRAYCDNLSTLVCVLMLSSDLAVIFVCKRFKDQVLLLEAPLRGVLPLLTAIQKVQTTTEHLTTLHPDFLQLCLLSKSYKTGLSVLGDDIFEVDHPRDLFLYCYYG